MRKRIQRYYAEQRRLFAEVTGESGYYNLGWAPESRRGSFAAAQRSLVKLVISQLKLQPRFRVLDVGCGLGQPALETAVDNEVEAIGLDLLYEPLKCAQHIKLKNNSGDFVHFVQGDAAVLPFEANSFNGVYSIESAFHYKDKALFLQESNRVLCPGGKLAIADIVLDDKKSDTWLHTAYKRALASPALYSTNLYFQTAKKIGLMPIHAFDLTPGVTRSLALAAQPLRKSMKKLLSHGYSPGFLLLIYFSFLHLRFTYPLIPAMYKLFVFKKNLTTKAPRR